jgi:4a-hydroxytetrahydrobiopterin dehydratase
MAILGDQELRDALAGRRNWRRAGHTLVRDLPVRDFAEALEIVERIGRAADDWGRHPDFAITGGGNRVRVTVTNANGAGFTDAEVRMVAKVDEVADAPRRPRSPVAAAVPAAPPAAEPAQAPEAQPQAEEDPAGEEPPEEPARGRSRRGIALVAVAGAVAAGAATVAVTRRR